MLVGNPIHITGSHFLDHLGLEVYRHDICLLHLCCQVLRKQTVSAARNEDAFIRACYDFLKVTFELFEFSIPFVILASCLFVSFKEIGPVFLVLKLF